jgi:hypothetical protein
VNAIDFDPPPRFHFGLGGEFDYLSPLMASWFAVEEIAHFEPTERYITGTALINDGSDKPGLQAEAFILAKIARVAAAGHPPHVRRHPGNLPGT